MMMDSPPVVFSANVDSANPNRWSATAAEASNLNGAEPANADSSAALLADPVPKQLAAPPAPLANHESSSTLSSQSLAFRLLRQQICLRLLQQTPFTHIHQSTADLLTDLFIERLRTSAIELRDFIVEASGRRWAAGCIDLRRLFEHGEMHTSGELPSLIPWVRQWISESRHRHQQRLESHQRSNNQGTNQVSMDPLLASGQALSMIRLCYPHKAGGAHYAISATQDHSLMPEESSSPMDLVVNEADRIRGAFDWFPPRPNLPSATATGATITAAASPTMQKAKKLPTVFPKPVIKPKSVLQNRHVQNTFYTVHESTELSGPGDLSKTSGEKLPTITTSTAVTPSTPKPPGKIKLINREDKQAEQVPDVNIVLPTELLTSTRPSLTASCIPGQHPPDPQWTLFAPEPAQHSTFTRDIEISKAKTRPSVEGVGFLDRYLCVTTEEMQSALRKRRRKLSNKLKKLKKNDSKERMPEEEDDEEEDDGEKRGMKLSAVDRSLTNSELSVNTNPGMKSALDSADNLVTPMEEYTPIE